MIPPAIHRVWPLAIFFVLFSFLAESEAQVQPYAGSAWFKHLVAGDARKLSAWMEPVVALELPSGSGKYNKQQATALLVSFFQDNVPTRIEIEKSGTTGNFTDFYIGTYQTETNEFRLYLLMIRSGGEEKIHSLSITKK